MYTPTPAPSIPQGACVITSYKILKLFINIHIHSKKLPVHPLIAVIYRAVLYCFFLKTKCNFFNTRDITVYQYGENVLSFYNIARTNIKKEIFRVGIELYQHGS